MKTVLFAVRPARRGAEWRRALGRNVVPDDQFDVNLEDTDLLEEVELVANLIVAATEADEHLTTEQIDKLLGIPEPRQGD
jgi:hypothetical protein